MKTSGTSLTRRGFIAMGLLSLLGFGTSEANAWNIPIKNFGQVVPGQIYRSAAPDFVSLQAACKEANIKSVLDLRDGWALAEWRGWAYVLKSRLGVTAYNIAFDDKSYPRQIDVDVAIQIMSNEENWPILVHCQGGRHRTGGIIAHWRKLKQGWTPEAAYKEAKAFDYYQRWGHKPWGDFIKAEVRK